jgi:hypothetical protein
MVDNKHPNPLPCGCGIKGTPFLDPLTNRGYEYKDLFIDFCPLHAAAPDLLEACQSALSLLQNIGTGKWTNTPAGDKLVKAIKKAEGK